MKETKSKVRIVLDNEWAIGLKLNMLPLLDEIVCKYFGLPFIVDSVIYSNFQFGVVPPSEKSFIFQTDARHKSNDNLNPLIILGTVTIYDDLRNPIEIEISSIGAMHNGE